MSNSPPILEDYQTKKELADEIDKTPRTLDRWDRLGIGPPRTVIGRTVLYRRTSTQKWLAAQERQGSCGARVERPHSRRARATA
jgi:hypothetical protein